MASVRKRVQKTGAASFAVLWRDPESGRQTSMTFPTEGEAEMLRRLLDANDQRFALAEQMLTAAASRKPTVSEMLERHLSLLTRANEGTIAGYRSMIATHFTEQLGGLRVDVVTDEHIAAWIQRQRRDGATRKSIANRMGLLSSAFKTAVRRGWRGDNPCELVELPNEDRAGRRATFLTKAEFDTLLEHIPQRHQMLTRVLVGTGMRFSEATALTWDDLHLDADVPYIQVNKAWKGDAHRKFFIGSTKNTPPDRDVSIAPGRAADLVAANRQHDLVFPNTLGSQLTNTTFHNHGWQDAVDASKLRKEPRPHDLRHTHASWLLQEGVPIFVVSRRLGHESVQTTTQIYGHLMPEALKDAADAMARIDAR